MAPIRICAIVVGNLRFHGDGATSKSIWPVVSQLPGRKVPGSSQTLCPADVDRLLGRGSIWRSWAGYRAGFEAG